MNIRGTLLGAASAWKAATWLTVFYGFLTGSIIATNLASLYVQPPFTGLKVVNKTFSTALLEYFNAQQLPLEGVSSIVLVVWSNLLQRSIMV